MANALTTKSRTEIAQNRAGDPFAKAASDMGGSAAVYMKLNGNTGEYTYGKDGEALDDGLELIADMQNFRRGWICWVDGEVVEEIMVRVVDGEPPAESKLTDHGPYVQNDERNDGWQEQAAITLIDPTDGSEFTFKVTSSSGIRGLGNLMKDYARQYKSHPDEMPVIALGTRSFMPKVKKHGRKYAPELKIVRWVNADELAEIAAGASGESEDDYEQDAAQVKAAAKPATTKPAASKATKPKPAPVEEPAEEQQPESAEEPDAPAAEEAPKPVPARRGARRRNF